MKAFKFYTMGGNIFIIRGKNESEIMSEAKIRAKGSMIYKVER